MKFFALLSVAVVVCVDATAILNTGSSVVQRSDDVRRETQLWTSFLTLIMCFFRVTETMPSHTKNNTQVEVPHDRKRVAPDTNLDLTPWTTTMVDRELSNTSPMPMVSEPPSRPTSQESTPKKTPLMSASTEENLVFIPFLPYYWFDL